MYFQGILFSCVLLQYAELETILGDADRARAIFELAIAQPKLDMPEVLWKAYVDFEIEQEEYNNTRNLYRRLLQRTQHVKVRGGNFGDGGWFNPYLPRGLSILIIWMSPFRILGVYFIIFILFLIENP